MLSVLLSALLGGFALGQAAPNFQYFSRARAAGGKCFALISRKPQLQSPESYEPVESDVSHSSTLELRGIDFAYPTRPDVMVACDLNIVVPAGHTVALVGESGSGKSTAVSLTQRFYDPIKGQVCPALPTPFQKPPDPCHVSSPELIRPSSLKVEDLASQDSHRMTDDL